MRLSFEFEGDKIKSRQPSKRHRTLPEKRQKFGKEASVHVSAHLVENKPISIRAFVDVMFHMSHMTMGMEITVNMHPYNKIPKSWTSLYMEKLIITVASR